MAEEESLTHVPIRLSIQINGEKTACVMSTVSKTVEEFRAMLLSQGLQLPKGAQFLDAQGYPVLAINEKSFILNDLVVTTNNNHTIKLKVTECTKISEENRNSLIHNQICPLLIKHDFIVLIDKLQCSTDDNMTDTIDYLTKQVVDNINGTEVLISSKKGLEKLSVKDYNENYVGMVSDWIANRTIYKQDYEWYNNMKSTWGHCPGQFNEKVEHSTNLIDDTPESIEEFTKSEFNEWPTNLTTRINLKRRQSALNSDTDSIDFKTNGKITTNMYLIAWKRSELGAIRIHTYVTIFERTAGHGCHFVPEYWTGQRDRINNAKKYYLLTKIESNPIYKEFLLTIPPSE